MGISLDDRLRERCADLRNPSTVNFTLSILILVGILVSYLPQHYRLIARRSSEGISPYYVLLGTTSGTCAFANILNISDSRHALACCKQLSGYECAAGVLGMAQIGVQWACFTIILFLFLLFFPRATPLAPPAKPTTAALPPPSNGKTEPEQPSFRTAIAVFILCILHAFAILFFSILITSLHPKAVPSWASFLGIFGTVLAAIQFLPQIYTTWRLQTVGSLSIPMMCIQTPGSLVWVGSLSARLGWEGWSTWGIYAVTGVLQGCLLAMGIAFEVRDRRKRAQWQEFGHNGHVEGEGNEERSSLLANER